MAKDINKSVFDDATLLKLNIFRECFKEWLPVFIHNPTVERVYIYDFFAGSGLDSSSNYGSPLILLGEAKGKDQMYCSKVPVGKIYFGFNEKIEEKWIDLQHNVGNYISNCLENCKRVECVYKIRYGKYEFKEAFERENVSKILSNRNYAKFVLLDQYGFKEVDSDVFSKLVKAPHTDFIFFISSSFIRRFKEHPYVVKYFETNKIKFDESRPNECHKYVADYFKSLIPNEIEYYLHRFTIKKGSNYYGLIFGTGHTLGMEKFLKVCWGMDIMSGESSFPMYNDYSPGSLFYSETETIKKNSYKEELTKAILMGDITSNIAGMKHALKNGVPTSAYLSVIESLLDKVTIVGNFNRKITNVHRLKGQDVYEIKVKK